MSNTHYKITGKALELANAFGFLFPAEVMLIQAIAQSLPPNAVAVDIGAGTGTGGLALVEIRPDLKVYTIDICRESPFGGLFNEQVAFHNTKTAPIPIQWLGSSQELHKFWSERTNGEMIDYLFIDGDHSESSLQGDIDGWLPYVKMGGYVLFHDYASPFWGGVTAVVNANMEKPGWRYVHQVDTLIVFQRGAGK